LKKTDKIEKMLGLNQPEISSFELEKNTHIEETMSKSFSMVKIHNFGLPTSNQTFVDIIVNKLA